MSVEAKEANIAFLNDLWGLYKADIAAQRSFDVSKIDALANNPLSYLQKFDGDAAQVALNEKLVDSVRTRIDSKAYLMEIFGENDKKNSFNQIDFQKYLKLTRSPVLPSNQSDAVAVIVAKGIIRDGTHKEGTIGGDSLSKLIAKARNDDSVKSLVLRVDSRGGSAFASELIRQEVLETKKAGKPVIVSMGSYAASGGYWISANADEIWAAPTTITGSIGVFGLFPTLEKPFNDILGIYRDGVGTNTLTGGIDIMSGVRPELGNMIQLSVETIYDKFLTLVAEGRGMEKEEVDKIAQGRVWSGQKAMELGLVDKIGELEDAIAAAATKANLENYEVKHIKRELSPKEQLMQEILQTSTAAWVGDDFSTLSNQQSFIDKLKQNMAEELQIIESFDDPNHIYAHCFCSLEN
ncbi:MAG: signal peptide peptidase SppA [Pseudomonadota bacterium]